MDFKYVARICPLRIDHVIRRVRYDAQWLQTHCQWYHMGDVRTHNSRTDSGRIFKLGGGLITRPATYDH